MNDKTKRNWRIRTMDYIGTAAGETAMEAAVAAFQSEPPETIGALVSAMPEGGTDDDEIFMFGGTVAARAGFISQQECDALLAEATGSRP